MSAKRFISALRSNVTLDIKSDVSEHLNFKQAKTKLFDINDIENGEYYMTRDLIAIRYRTLLMRLRHNDASLQVCLDWF